MSKRLSRVLARCLGAVALGAVGPVAAGTSLGDLPVNGVNMKETRNVIIGTGAHANPDGCTLSSVVMILADHPGQQEMVATVLAAKATRAPVDFVVEGCVSAYGNTYPVVTELSWD